MHHVCLDPELCWAPEKQPLLEAKGSDAFPPQKKPRLTWLGACNVDIASQAAALAAGNSMILLRPSVGLSCYRPSTPPEALVSALRAAASARGLRDLKVLAWITSMGFTEG